MQMHDALICKQSIVVAIDAGPIVDIRNVVAALDTFDDLVELRPKVWALADASEILKLFAVNRLGLGLDPTERKPLSRSGWLQSP
jgi:hypothetical protein